ncbi:MAG: M3 family metallopeptidase [Polaromonas sp.]|nr:M3 family metallopeptidase [Polaromonas sp.]MBP6142133.1 M3 family metallopeptidase [Polaromonas sp.]MBP6155850.1 M3 family metallopeptidase [Polaromonas sp.]MBP7115803.1 M3 family metallopeptidase [Polaromonas sp.]MBP7307728.1 M3 family metallopeptidase [Polaromonas sp.]
MTETTNPLLSPFKTPVGIATSMPLFDQIKPTHVAPAMDTLLAHAQQALDTVTAADFPAQWLDISKELDVATEQLGRAWGAVNHLNHVADTPELRAAYNEALPKVTAFYTALGANEALYAKYKAIDVSTLNTEQLQAHKNAIRNFVLSGAELTGVAKERFAQIQERLAELSQKFSENALDATEAFVYYASMEELQGVPDDVLQAAQTAAAKDAASGKCKTTDYKLSLKMPCYLPVMQFANSSRIREVLYKANSTRASDQASYSTVDSVKDAMQFDNSNIITEMLALKNEEAQLLGYNNHAEVSLATKMADTPAQVIQFLRDLGQRARPYAEQDLADMRSFAKEHLNMPDPQAWDWPYIGEKLKEARYSFNEQEVKQYFPLPKVLAGLFKIVETLFDVSIRQDQAPVWNDAVKFYRIERGSTLIGQFYLDPNARTGKRGGAWMDDVRARWLRPDSGQLQTPVAHLVCNFADGVDGKPALLTHDDVITLFHECGHGLQHMLTTVNERDVSGISGVEWDAVELPSQFMENFCWEWDVLKHMTAHVETGAPLPRELFDKMIAAKNYQSGLQTLRQIEFSLFDMLLHTQTRALSNDEVLSLLRQVRQEIAVIQAPSYSRTSHTFSHIFAGGYAAGYYSYKWAEVLSADAYAAFEEARMSGDVDGKITGLKYRQAILESGGSRPAMESFKAFRGREPQLDALLRHQGMA